MNCIQSQQQLSAYHDGELAGEQRVELDVHLEGCPHCLNKLIEIRHLSQATQKLPTSRPPDDLWNRILASLEQEQPAPRRVARATSVDDGIASNLLTRRLIHGSLATASVLLIGLGILSWVQERHHAAHDRNPLEKYVLKFGSDPGLAQQRLTTRYSGQAVSADRAVQLVGYRPVNVEPPPDGFRLHALYVLEMPCCKCVEAVWKRDDDSCVAIFEHTTDPEEWFQHYSSVQVPCAGKPCRVIEVSDQLVASWRRGRRTITVIGLRDIEELSRLITKLN